jgi:general secretion pathway protein H
MRGNSSPTRSRPSKVRRPIRRGRVGGFTLLELMVVVVIIGLLAAAMVLSVGITGKDQPLEKESDRAAALVRYAREKAEVETREFGLYLGEHEYEFLTYDPRKGLWRSVDEDESLRLRELPAGLKLSLVVEGRSVVLKSPDPRQTEKQREEEAKTRVPHVIIYSNGDLTPFELTLEREDPVRSVTIASTDEGKIEASALVEGRRT